MNRKTILFCFFIIFFLKAVSIAREVQTLQTGWKFARGDHEKAWEVGFDDSGWQDVTVPHDWAISGPFITDGDGTTGKLPWKGEGWYRTTLDIRAHQKGNTMYLVFDGIMAFPEIYVNGHLAGTWDYGYNSFYLDITDYVQFDRENILAIHVDTRPHDSRWYPGAGIYRKVQMVTVDPTHVGIWGTHVTTPIIKPHSADVRVMTTVRNTDAHQVDALKMVHVIVNPDGREIARKEIPVTIAPGTDREVETTFMLTDPRRWDIVDPVLYTLNTIIYKNNEEVDRSTTNFGIRTMRFTANHGFYLNDRRVPLKGVNLHHDHGPLGAAFYPRAMERQLEIMKAMGCNAIRTSHNTAAPELLEMCDRMGLLVFNEVFDKYDGKAGITDSTAFEAFAHRNIRNFVVRDRNHPSIFLWSVGNEIGDVQWNINNGFHRLHTMVNYVRKYDPTRPVTLVCDNMNSATLRHFDYYDVHSWNYGRRYRLARQLEPDKSVIISESASTVSTRGFYELPLPVEKTDFTRSLQVSSYDLNAPGWAEIADDDFMWQQEEPYVAGEFVWTGFDYLGEPTPYHNGWTNANGMTDREASRSSYFGIVDLCGIPKDRYYLYKSYWKPDETTVHILPHWNWEGSGHEKIPVFVYTNGDCAELFLNGKSLGKQCKDPASEKSVERFRLMWHDVTYAPGELKAVAYKEGAQIGEAMVRTAGTPDRIRLTADRTTLTADGTDLSYVLVEAFDAGGNPCPLADQEIKLVLNGPGRIAGVGNGNPQSFEPFQSSTVKLFYGKAMVILRSGFEKGTLNLTAASKGWSEESIQISIE
jgi:beta-galactosidase